MKNKFNYMNICNKIKNIKSKIIIIYVFREFLYQIKYKTV